MTRILASLLSLVLLSCAHAPPLETREGEEIKRKPDGVLLEPSPAIPQPVERADARGVVALKLPLSIEDVRVVVKQLMTGISNEQQEVINQLLLPDATDLVSHYGREQMLTNWRQRFARLEYQKLRGIEVTHLERAEMREFDDLQTTGAHARPAEMVQGDLFVRIPITAPLSNGERLFDDVLLLLLRRDAQGGLKIAAMGETN